MKTKSPLLVIAAIAFLAVSSGNVHAQTVINWTGGTSTNWTTGSNWDGGTAPTNNLTSNIVGFNSATYSFQPFAPNNQQIAGIQVGASSGAVTIDTAASANRLQIGSSGITMASGAGALTLGVGTTDGVLVGASQAWENNSASALGWRTINTANNLGTVTLTLQGSGSGGFSQSANGIGEASGSTLAIVVDYSGSGNVLMDKGNNTFSGGLTIKQGTVVINQSDGSGNGTVTLGFNAGTTNATLTSAYASGTRTYAAPMVLASGHTGNLTIGGTGSGSGTFTGGVTGTNNLIVENIGTGVLAFSTNGLNFTGNLTKKGVGIAQFAAANTFGGSATVEAGTLRLANVNALQNATLDTGTAGTQSVTFTVAGTNTYNLGGLQGADELAIGGNSISVGANGGNTTFSGAISGTGGALTKTGIGRLTLASTNTYTGATSVQQGVLLVDGSTAAGSAVSVSSGAVFGGNGIVNGNLTLANGALFAFDTAYTLDLGGSSTFALNNSFGVGSLRNLNGGAIDWSSIANGTYTLIQGGNLGANFFSASNISNFGVANAFVIGGGRSAYFDNGSLALTVIPEPSTLALLAVSLTSLAIFRRRRRRQSN